MAVGGNGGHDAGAVQFLAIEQQAVHVKDDRAGRTGQDHARP